MQNVSTYRTALGRKGGRCAAGIFYSSAYGLAGTVFSVYYEKNIDKNRDS